VHVFQLCRSLQLQEQISNLTEKKLVLQQDEERSKQRPEEQKEQLMQKIKRDNTEADQVSRQGQHRTGTTQKKIR